MTSSLRYEGIENEFAVALGYKQKSAYGLSTLPWTY